jgi:hypothetical protein
MLALVRHTVAARLFDDEISEEHLGFCSEVAAAVPVARLEYPRQMSAMPLIASEVASFIDQRMQ